MLLMARPCRSMRAHAARRPNVFVLGAKPLLQWRLPRQASGGPGRPTLDASAAASTDTARRSRRRNLVWDSSSAAAVLPEFPGHCRKNIWRLLFFCRWGGGTGNFQRDYLVSQFLRIDPNVGPVTELRVKIQRPYGESDYRTLRAARLGGCPPP